MTSLLATSQGIETILLNAFNIIKNLSNHQKEEEDKQDFLTYLISDTKSEKSDWNDNISEKLTDLSNKNSHQKAQSCQSHP